MSYADLTQIYRYLNISEANGEYWESGVSGSVDGLKAEKKM